MRSAWVVIWAMLLTFIPSAAFAYSFNQTWGGPSHYGGYGNYQGTLNYSGARAFNWDITIQDICPADGVGVSTYFVVNRVDGHMTTSPVKAWDTNGCGNGFNQYSGTITREWNIRDARIIPCWTNDGNLCWQSSLDGWSTLKDNPYT